MQNLQENKAMCGGWSVTEVSRLFGKDPKTIRRWMKGLRADIAILIRRGANGRLIIPIRVINELSWANGARQNWEAI